ncbi:MAG: enoyl-CoA hydratase/isomerase family protein [Myxococcales bacterium]|nr:enoyl-CoA hydratase/isomerase family protein [Myxococcales bacterium]
MGQFVEVREDAHVVTVTVNRPDRLNALDAQVLGDLDEAFRALAESRTARAAVLTGAGKAFVAGADIASMAKMNAEDAQAFARRGQSIFGRLETLPFPVIAAVNGYALGGGLELALACDFIYASTNARLGQPEVKIGVIPGFGGTQRLLRRVGVSMARELIYTGAQLTADEALRIGLVNRVCAPEELLKTASETAVSIAAVAPLAVGAAKRVLFHGAQKPISEALIDEAAAFGQLFATADQKEGMAAFLEKRGPAYRGE